MKSRTHDMTVSLALSLTLIACTSTFVRAGLDCCTRCGQEAQCQKVCRWVTENKKVTTTCWGFQTEEFCDPCPSDRGCEHEEYVCNESQDSNAPCVQPKRFVWTEWLPTGARHIYTKKKLMKRTVTKTVPSHKWVVENCCSQCLEK